MEWGVGMGGSSQVLVSCISSFTNIMLVVLVCKILVGSGLVTMFVRVEEMAGKFGRSCLFSRLDRDEEQFRETRIIRQ